MFSTGACTMSNQRQGSGPEGNYRNRDSSGDRSRRMSGDHYPPERTSLVRTLGGGAALAFLIAGGAVAGSAVVYANNVSAALALKPEVALEVEEEGVAEIVQVDMNMPPITLATAETKVTDVKVAYEQKLTGLFDISLGSNTVTRNATVETLINVDPGEVTITYDPEEEQLTFTALETALSTKVDIPTGGARTTDKTGSLMTLPAEWITKVSEAIDGTFGTDNSSVPIVREVADGTLAINEGLERFADINIVAQVDQQCTPLIQTEIKDFKEQLEENIRIAVKGQLLEPTATNEVSSALLELPLSEVQVLVENAIIEIPDDYKIGPDQEKLQEIKDYEKSKFFTTTLEDDDAIKCGVSSNTKLIPNEEGEQ